MTQEVRSREGELGREGGARHKLCCHLSGVDMSMHRIGLRGGLSGRMIHDLKKIRKGSFGDGEERGGGANGRVTGDVMLKIS